MKIDVSAFMNPERVVFPPPWVGHIPFASWLIATVQPGTLVELGTHSGNSYCAFCQAIVEHQTQTKSFAIDTWQGDEHSKAYGIEVFEDLAAYHDSKYSDFSLLLRMTFDEASSRFSAGQIDILHIDGLHTYEAVRHDFETWVGKLSDRGIVLFHDTNVRGNNFGVHRLFAELRTKYPGFELLNSNGLGVLLVGEHRHAELLSICEDDDRLQAFRKCFTCLGAGIESKFQLTELQKELEASSEQLTAHRASVHDHTIIRRENEAALTALQARCLALETRYESQSGVLALLRADMKGRDAASAAELLELKRKILAMESSRAWRLIRPLHRIGRMFNGMAG